MPIEPWWETNPATTPRQELGMVSPELTSGIACRVTDSSELNRSVLSSELSVPWNEVTTELTSPVPDPSWVALQCEGSIGPQSRGLLWTAT